MSVCRICLDDDEENNMIAPCLCAGTNKFVHRRCLESWCEISSRSDARTLCPNCRHKYTFETLSWWDKMKSYGRNFLNCMYSLNGLVVFAIATIDMTTIYPLSQFLTPNSIMIQSNHTSIEPQVIIELGRSLATICIIVPISLFCFFWEVTSTNSLDACSNRFGSRFIGHLFIIALSSNWIMAASFFHALGISRWFEFLPEEAKWCKKPIQRHILDLNESDDETV